MDYDPIIRFSQCHGDWCHGGSKIYGITTHSEYNIPAPATIQLLRMVVKKTWFDRAFLLTVIFQGLGNIWHETLIHGNNDHCCITVNTERIHYRITIDAQRVIYHSIIEIIINYVRFGTFPSSRLIIHQITGGSQVAVTTFTYPMNRGSFLSLQGEFNFSFESLNTV